MRAIHVNTEPVRTRFGGRFCEMTRRFRLMLVHKGSQFGKVLLRQFFDRARNFFYSAHTPIITEQAQRGKRTLASALGEGYFELRLSFMRFFAAFNPALRHFRRKANFRYFRLCAAYFQRRQLSINKLQAKTLPPTPVFQFASELGSTTKTWATACPGRWIRRGRGWRRPGADVH